jgi:hypothetical protein
VFCVEFFLSSSPATSAVPVVMLLLLFTMALEDGRELFEVLRSLYEEFVLIMGPPPAPKEESSFIFFIDKFEY